MPIPFTQYLMPHGRRSPQLIARPEEVEAKAEAVMALGGSFEMEMLNVAPGLPNVSITCAFEDEDISHEIVVNGPPVLEAVDLVVADAYRILVQAST